MRDQQRRAPAFQPAHRLLYIVSVALSIGWSSRPDQNAWIREQGARDR